MFDRVREACARVASQAEYVQIARDPGAYARDLLQDEPLHALDVGWDVATHYRGTPAETIAYVVTLDAINFGSGYFPHLDKRPGLSGYFTIAVALKERFEQHGPFGAEELRGLTLSDIRRTFGQTAGDGVRDELMLHFCRALRDLGTFLEEHCGGSFEELVERADRSAERLVGSLLAMPYFRDVALYRHAEVPLYKRAQITPSDLALALEGHPLGRFDDLDRLTIFADNLVPHVLRLDGVLEYAPALVARLERGDLLEPGSPEEVEIRAVALHAVELMAAGLPTAGLPTAVGWTPRRLDLLLWNRGQAERYRGGSKHRTRSVFY